MRAVRCSDGVAALVEVPAPQGEGIRVRVASAGICGSDLHLESWNLPATLGHEMAGFLADGTPVAVEPIAPCRSCAQCQAGAYNRCEANPGLLGVNRDGGMADECLVPPGALVPLPPGIAVADACLVEPLAVAVHGVRRGRVAPGDRVAIVGGGTIGQMAVAAAQAAGAAVDMEARHERQREAASGLGAGSVSGHYDVVIDSAGTGPALARAVALCRPGGRVVLLGTYWDPVEMPGLAIGMAEIDLVPASMYGSAGGQRDIDTAAAIMTQRTEIPALVITHRFPLDGVREAFAAARDRSAGAIKVVLEP